MSSVVQNLKTLRMKPLKNFFIVAGLLLCAGSLCCQSKLQTRTLPVEISSPSPHLQGELLIEVGLVYESGDVKPVARSDFYLLDDDAEKIPREAKIERRGKLGKHELDYFNAYAVAQACVNLLTQCASLKESWDFMQEAKRVLKPHIIQTVTTGFDGKARFEPVATGNYHVMGIMLRKKGFASWNLKVEVKPTPQTVILDQNNAALII